MVNFGKNKNRIILQILKWCWLVCAAPPFQVVLCKSLSPTTFCATVANFEKKFSIKNAIKILWSHDFQRSSHTYWKIHVIKDLQYKINFSIFYSSIFDINFFCVTGHLSAKHSKIR